MPHTRIRYGTIYDVQRITNPYHTTIRHNTDCIITGRDWALLDQTTTHPSEICHINVMLHSDRYPHHVSYICMGWSFGRPPCSMSCSIISYTSHDLAHAIALEHFGGGFDRVWSEVGLLWSGFGSFCGGLLGRQGLGICKLSDDVCHARLKLGRPPASFDRVLPGVRRISKRLKPNPMKTRPVNTSIRAHDAPLYTIASYECGAQRMQCKCGGLNARRSIAKTTM